MKVGDLVKMRAQRVDCVYGVGVIVREITKEEEHLGFQILWSKYGLGNRCARHSLELVGESKKG